MLPILSMVCLKFQPSCNDDFDFFTYLILPSRTTEVCHILPP